MVDRNHNLPIKNNNTKLLISPSLLSANNTYLIKEIEKVEKYSDLLHIDVMDGHFVPNISFGSKVVKDIKSITKLPLEVHLMVTNPKDIMEVFIKAGADIIIYHIEAVNQSINDLITQRGIKAGVSINPPTNPSVIYPYTENLYEILIMSVNPGFGYQSFIDNSLNKIKWVKNNITKSTNILINVDGGVNKNNLKRCIESGIDIATIGSAIFNEKSDAESNIKDIIESLKGM